MTCAGCQAAIADDARFCSSCGEPVRAPSPARELRKTVTVLFCDMTDSTALSGRLDPESLRELMVRYYALMSSVLERHGGTVEKFIGDAVVAVFGVPVLHEDDASRALTAATEMLAAVESLNADLNALIGEQIGIRIGVNSGEVVVAEHATARHALAAGEAVNVAARLQQHAAPGEIIIGPVTRALVGSAAIVVPMGELTLKGRATPMPAWQLVGLRPYEVRGLHRVNEPFFGRAAELAELQRLLDQTITSGACHLVVIHGDAGVGKTRLADEFAVKAIGDGVLVGSGRCLRYGEGSTLYALAEALSQIVDAARDCGALEPGPGRDVRDALASLGSGLFRDGSPGELPDQVVWAATLVLRTIGRRRPVLVIIDDLQSAKPMLLDVLGELTARVSDAAVLLLVVARSELLESPGWWAGGQPGASLMPLGPLSDAESELLVAALGEVTPHQAGLTREIIRRAEGNPFFLEQLVAITEQGGKQALPPTIWSVIAARLDLLEAVHRDVLLRAAVPGVRFTAPELAALLAAEPVFTDPPEQALGALAHRRLVVAERATDEFRFAGVLIRDVAYNTLSKRARLSYHEQLAVWYRRNAQADDLVGQHLEHAYRLAAELYPAGHEEVRRLRSDAGSTLARAGEFALRRSDLQWAADLLARALELHDAAAPGAKAVRVLLAETGLLLGTDPDAKQTLRTLAAQAHADGDQRTACHAGLLLAALELPGPTAAEDALAAVPVFEAVGDHLGLTRAWLRVAQLNQLGGRYGQAEVLLRYALRHALQTDTQFELATVIGSLATSLWRGPTPAEAALAGCHDLLTEHAEGRRAVRATVNCPRAVLLASRGEHDRARSLVLDSAEIIEQLGHVYGAASVLTFGAAVEGLAGRWDCAEDKLRDALRTSASHGDTLSVTAATAGLTRALLEQGDPEGALRVARDVDTTSDPLLDADIYGVRARALAESGDGHEAWLMAARACAVAAVTDSTACQATAELDRAFVLRALGDLDMAAVAAEAAEQLFEMKGHMVGAKLAASFVAQGEQA